MMKKAITILLGMVLVFSCCVSLAETTEKQRIGKLNVFGDFTLEANLPEGYELVSQVPEGYESMMIAAEMVSQDKNKPRFSLLISYNDTWSKYERFNDLPENEVIEIENSFKEQAKDVEISYAETANGTKLLMAHLTDGSLGSVYTIYKSYEIEIILIPTEEPSLTDEEFEEIIQFISDLDFVENAEENPS